MDTETTAPMWREIRDRDVPVIDEIGNAIHVNLQERRDVFVEKVRLFPAGCRVLIYSGEIVGYGISHPWHLYRIPTLDTFLERLPSRPDCVFMHDVVVLPRARGHAAAIQFVEIIAAAARERNIPSLSLVSVYDTHPLWAKCGFEVVQRRELAEKLKSYGDTARYMVRNLN